VTTNQAFLLQLLEDEAFARAETFTHTLEAREWSGPAFLPDEVLAAAAVALHAPPAARGGRDDGDRYSPWLRLGTWGRLPAAAGGEPR
jgi:hypothetical protein